MKRFALSFSICLLLLAVGANTVSSATAPAVTVQFVNPAKFTDFSIHGRDANYTAGVFSNSVKDELTPVLRQKYPNSSLVLRFTDVDLAGRYTTGRNARIIGTAHPARMKFEFRLTDSSGRVLANGDTRLVDSSSLASSKNDPRRSQAFYYERRLLNRWLRTLSVRK